MIIDLNYIQKMSSCRYHQFRTNVSGSKYFDGDDYFSIHSRSWSKRKQHNITCSYNRSHTATSRINYYYEISKYETLSEREKVIQDILE